MSNQLPYITGDIFACSFYRSVSSCSSGERLKKKTGKQRSKEMIDARQRDHERGLVSKDRRRGRSRSTSQSKSRSRSRSRSKDRKRRQGSKSRSRSREKWKDQVESLSKVQRKHRSSSGDRREDDPSSKKSQKTSGSCSTSSKDTRQLRHKKKEENVQRSLTDKSKVKKQALSKSEKERKNLSTSSQLTASRTKDLAVVKKKKKQPVDVFDFLITKPLKEEPERMDISSVAITKYTDEEEIKEDSIKADMCKIKSETLEITPMKSEPGSPEMGHLPTGTSLSALTTPVDAQPQDVVSQCQPVSVVSAENSETAVFTASVKQEAQSPSDSDEDFNVDVMLDSLDYVMSEHTERNGAYGKREEGGEGEKTEGDPLSAVVGAKSKPPVKRVTWNIQEPEGPQPEKSASSK